MTDEDNKKIVDLTEVRRILKEKQVNEDGLRALDYFLKFYEERERVEAAMKEQLDALEVFTFLHVQDSIIESTGISRETMRKIGDDINGARAALKSVYDDLVRCEHWMSDAVTRLLVALREE